MPIKKTAMKELKKTKKRHARNLSIISNLRSSAKKLENLILEKKLDEAAKEINEFKSKIDKAASKGIVHKNLASRKIARLMKRLALASKA